MLHIIWFVRSSDCDECFFKLLRSDTPCRSFEFVLVDYTDIPMVMG